MEEEKKIHGKTKCCFYLCFWIVLCILVSCTLYWRTCTANKQLQPFLYVCFFFNIHSCMTNKSWKNEYARKRDTSYHRIFVVKRKMLHIPLYNWTEKKQILVARKYKKKQIFECVRVLFFLWSVLLISRQQKIIGIAKFKGGIVNEDNAFPLCHVSCTISFGYLQTFCVMYFCLFSHGFSSRNLRRRQRRWCGWDRSIGSALAILSVVMTMLMML